MVHAAPEPAKGYFMSKGLYDVVKLWAQIILPAIGTLYFTLAGVWGLPAAEQVVGTIVAVDTFLGVLLRISTNSYEASGAKYDGVVNVVRQLDGTKLFDLELTNNPEVLETGKEIVFKVNKPNG